MNNENMNAEQVSLQRPNNYNDNNNNYADEDDEAQGIKLSQIWHMIIKHWVALVICLLVGFAGGFAYSKIIKTPKFQATTQLMIVNTDTATTTSSNQNISEALQKTQIAYGYLTSDEVVHAVYDELKAKNTDDRYKMDFVIKDKTTGEEKADYESVKKLYSVTIPTVVSNSTSIFINITSTAKNEALAVDVANFVPKIAIELVNNDTSLGYAYLKNSLASLGNVDSAKDTSTSTIMLALIGTLIGLVVGAAYGIIRELANTHVSSKTELEQLTGFKVIGMIPMYNSYVANTETKEETKKGDEQHA